MTTAAYPDARGLGSPSFLRFVLLLLLFVAGAAGLSGQVVLDVLSHGVDDSTGCALAAGLNPEVTFRFDAFSSIHDDAGLRACWARFVPNTGWVPLVVVPAALLVAAVVYRLLPAWKGRRSRLAPVERVDRDGRVRAHLAELVAEAGVGGVRFGVDPTAVTAGAVVFGTRRRPVVRLHSGLLVLHERDYQRFRAVVLHELAHVRNGDVPITYATVAMWRVFLGGVLLPSAGGAVYELAGMNWPAAWHLLSVPVYTLIEEALIVALVYLTRADILRTRELHADLTAAGQWNVRPAELVDACTVTSRNWLTASRDVLLNHPSWQLRGRTLTAPDALFSLGAWAMFATGLIADIFVSQLDSVPTGPAALGTARVLLTAGLITAIGGIGIWRAVLYAHLRGGPQPVGWVAGWWLGAGLAVGELVIHGSRGGGWLPPHPEALLIPIAVVIVLTAWTTEYARLRVRPHSSSLGAAMTVGLVPPWLVLAFGLTWWRFLMPLEGWLPSSTAVLDGLGLPGAHSPLLVRIGSVITFLPGASTTFGGLWWAVPLLWLLPLVLWTQRAGLPGLSRIMRAGLIGGLAAGGGVLAARIGVATVHGLGNPAVDGSVEFTWVVLVVTAAMLGTAAVVGAMPSDYPLLAAAIASGITAVVGMVVAYLQLSVGGCLGAANALFQSHCAARPGFPFSQLVSWSGYLLGSATIACLGIAMLASAFRRGATTASVSVGIPRRRTVAVIISAAVVITTASTIDSTFVTPTTEAGPSYVRPAPTPSPRTRGIQVDAWLYYGGGDLAERIDLMGDTTMADVVNRGTDASDVQRDLSSVCARLSALTKDADDYLPVPVAAGQRFWAAATDALRSAATACHRATAAHDLNAFLAAYDDVQNAETEIDALAAWTGPVGTAPGMTPVIATFGEHQQLAFSGVTYRFTPANLAIRQTGPTTRVATLDVAVCIAGLPPNTTFAADHPPAQLWRLVFADGTQIAADPSVSLSNEPLFPPPSQGEFSEVNDCVAGVIPFVIPATEHGDPQRVMVAPRSVSQKLVWNVPRQPSHTTDILGTPERTANSGPAWIAVTGYAAHRAGAQRRTAHVTVQTCGIPTTTAGSWALLLADGATVSPAAAHPAGDDCHDSTITFDLADKSDPVEIQYNAATIDLFWQLAPPSQ